MKNNVISSVSERRLLRGFHLEELLSCARSKGGFLLVYLVIAIHRPPQRRSQSSTCFATEAQTTLKACSRASQWTSELLNRTHDLVYTNGRSRTLFYRDAQFFKTTISLSIPLPSETKNWFEFAGVSGYRKFKKSGVKLKCLSEANPMETTSSVGVNRRSGLSRVRKIGIALYVKVFGFLVFFLQIFFSIFDIVYVPTCRTGVQVAMPLTPLLTNY